MKFIYKIISEIFLILSPIIILYRILKKKENPKRFFERYAITSKIRKKGKLIWFHCSSVGELLSIIPIVEKFENNKKIKQILITTTTLSSSKIFETIKFKKTQHQFFPIDNDLIINKFLNYWKPSIFFLCESEIWPNLIYNIKQKKIKLILLNGRMTLKSFKRWKVIQLFSREIFKKFNTCFAQNQETYKRLFLLGAKKVKYIGNLKFTTRKKAKFDTLNKQKLNFFKNKKILITAASTHYNEENFVFQNHLYFKNKKSINKLISIIVPRHIERSGQIKKEAENYSLKTHMHSSKKKINRDSEVYIVDTYGELNKFYKISNLVFMGGSLINHGGQNPLEPAKLGCKIIHGPNISNFKEIYNKLGRMEVSILFKKYLDGSKIIERNFSSKNSFLLRKRLAKYGNQILNSTYFELTKFI